MRIGNVIKKYRYHEELTLRALGKEIGVSARSVMRLEQGYEIKIKTMMKIMKWLFD